MMDVQMPEMDGYEAGPRPAPTLSRRGPAAHHRPHGLGAARRPQPGPGRRHERLAGQAFRAGRALYPAGALCRADLGTTLTARPRPYPPLRPRLHTPAGSCWESWPAAMEDLY
ncbi:MAG: hypothetical protein WKG07_24845 [Hymenobacter sp.]